MVVRTTLPDDNPSRSARAYMLTGELVNCFLPVDLTLTLHNQAEEKRVRVRQMWARAGWDRMNST
jgi:hypothetical protein